MTVKQAFSEYYYVPGVEKVQKKWSPLDRGRRVKFGQKFAEAPYGWWSTYFLLVKNSGKKVSICCSIQEKWDGYLNGNSESMFLTFLFEPWFSFLEVFILYWQTVTLTFTFNSKTENQTSTWQLDFNLEFCVLFHA